MRIILAFSNFCTPVTKDIPSSDIPSSDIPSSFRYFQLSWNLFQVHVLLRSSNWDTRVAASQAVEAIVKNVPSWEPVPIKTESN